MLSVSTTATETIPAINNGRDINFSHDDTEEDENHRFMDLLNILDQVEEIMNDRHTDLADETYSNNNGNRNNRMITSHNNHVYKPSSNNDDSEAGHQASQ